MCQIGLLHPPTIAALTEVSASNVLITYNSKPHLIIVHQSIEMYVKVLYYIEHMCIIHYVGKVNAQKNKFSIKDFLSKLEQVDHSQIYTTIVKNRVP